MAIHKMLAVVFILSMGISLTGGSATAQSSLSLDSFDLGTDDRPADAPTAVASAADCLTGDGACDPEMRSARSFSLEDVVNLGIVDRREVASPEGADPVETAQRSATPLPSIDIEVLFDYASDQLRRDQLGSLFDLARELRRVDFAGRELVLMGHTDAVGSHVYNRDLSLRRAQAVADFLGTEAGIPRHRIRAAGVAFDYLKYPHDPYHAANRRVQIMMIEL